MDQNNQSKVTQVTSSKTIFGPGVTPASESYQQLNQQNQNQAIKRKAPRRWKRNLLINRLYIMPIMLLTD